MVASESLPEYLTVLEVAGKLHLHPETIRRHCRGNKIPGAKQFGGYWRIPASWLAPDPAGPTPQSPSPQIGG
jgi:excisionase family DNA binding protein